MGLFRYISNRTLLNKKGAENGKLRVVVRTGSDDAEVDYVCPECKASQHVVQKWKRPFSIRCGKCNFLMRLPKLKKK